MSVVYIIIMSVDLLSSYYGQFRATFVYLVSDCKTLLVLQFTFHPSWYLQAATPFRYLHLTHTHTFVCARLYLLVVMYHISIIALVLIEYKYLLNLFVN